MGSSSSSGIGLAQIAVPVSDIERAIAFYRDILGMRFLFDDNLLALMSEVRA